MQRTKIQNYVSGQSKTIWEIPFFYSLVQQNLHNLPDNTKILTLWKFEQGNHLPEIKKMYILYYVSTLFRMSRMNNKNKNVFHSKILQVVFNLWNYIIFWFNVDLNSSTPSRNIFTQNTNFGPKWGKLSIVFCLRCS